MKYSNKNNVILSLLSYAFRIFLGCMFIYAAYHKIESPDQFAKIVYGYDFFPAQVINLIAVILPFIELTTGFALIMGWYPRSALLIISGMLVMFILLIGFNLLRGHEFDCGCFSASTGTSTESNVLLLVRDCIFLLMAGFLFIRLKNPERS